MNDFDIIKVVSSSELTSEQEHRLLDNVEMWTVSENSMSTCEREENSTHVCGSVRSKDSEESVPARRKKFKHVKETSILETETTFEVC